ncbi:hypothetical protein [Aldersonia kunmingensis]|uniref:hypothetical protein n=1 Tax=Aldersonia kunmingensis TaxID=408066 RepID=UPI0008370A9C|nr:hypothetical protein [Aldersonia kunmingensis]
MRKLIFMAALVLPLLGAGVAQAQDTGSIQTDNDGQTCTGNPTGLGCEGGLTLQDLIEMAGISTGSFNG